MRMIHGDELLTARLELGHSRGQLFRVHFEAELGLLGDVRNRDMGGGDPPPSSKEPTRLAGQRRATCG